MLELYSNIKARREELGLSQSELAELTGYTSKTSISKIESGRIDLPQSKIAIFANALRTTPGALMGPSLPEGCKPVPDMTKVPLLGTIACGTPILAEENLDGQVIVPDFVHADFALKCKGDSMIGARIMDGDIVCVRSQPDVDDGEIAAVLIGDEATLKRVYKIPGRLILRPENPAFQVMEYAGEELDEIKILGKAVYFVSAVR